MMKWSFAIFTAAWCFVAMPQSATAFPGQVTNYRNGTVAVWNNFPEQAAFTEMPDGVFGLKNRGRNFRYRLRFDGKKTDKATVQKFVVSFCKLMDKKAGIAFSKENRVRNQVADFACQ